MSLVKFGRLLQRGGVNQVKFEAMFLVNSHKPELSGTHTNFLTADRR